MHSGADGARGIQCSDNLQEGAERAEFRRRERPASASDLCALRGLLLNRLASGIERSLTFSESNSAKQNRVDRKIDRARRISFPFFPILFPCLPGRRAKSVHHAVFG